MNFLQLRYFVLVAQNRSFSAAAKSLYLSQQTISAQIAQLEKELDVVLFDRSHPLKLTKAGEKLYKTSEQFLFLKDQLNQELNDLSDSKKHTLRLGISSAYARAVLPQLLDAFFVHYPDVKLELYEGTFADLNQLLISQKVDLVLSRPLHGDNIVSIPVLEERICLFAPEKVLLHNFGANYTTISTQLAEKVELEVLKSCPFILPRSGSMRESCNELFLSHQMTPLILVETDFLETAIKLCEVGLGVTIAAESMLVPLKTEYGSENLYYLEDEISWKSLSVCYLKNVYVSKIMNAFISTCKNHLRDICSI